MHHAAEREAVAFKDFKVQGRLVSSNGVGNSTTTHVYANGAVNATSLSIGNYSFPTTDGTQNQFLVTNGNGSISFTTVDIDPSYSYKTFNYTASRYDTIVADTTAGSFTVTLPSSPLQGDWIKITDGNNWGINNLNVARNGSTIEGYTEDLILNLGNVVVDLVYTGSTWIVFSTAGIQGAQGEKGDTGETGAKGEKGDTGAEGVKGEVGLTGAKGEKGDTGEQGFKGEKGDTGTKGELGTKGDKGEVGVTGANGTIGSYVYKTSNYNASVYDVIAADTTSGAFTITLPSTPSEGDWVRLADGYNWQVNNLTIARNGSTIEGYAEDLILNLGNIVVDLIYTGSTWIVFSTAGTKGETGAKGDAGTLSFPITEAASFSNTLSIQGLLSTTKVEEGFTTISNANNVFGLDCANGHIFNITTPQADFTPSLTNFTLANNKATSVVLVINQGVTARVPTSNVQIDGVNTAVAWQGGSTPSGASNKKDVVAYSILNASGTYTILGQLTSFG